MKRKISLFIVLLTTVLILSGCGSSNDAVDVYYGDDYQTIDTDPIAPDPIIGVADLAGGDVLQSAVIPALENRKIIYTAGLTMESDDPSVIYNNVIDNLDTYSAYIESAQINSIRYVVKIRVLSTNFTEFVEEIKTSGDVISFSKTSDDITNSYSTFEARKLALETQHTRILELIAEAVNLEDIITLEDARFEIETELNQIGASLANYDSLIDFSTINLVINRISETVFIAPRTSSPTVRVLEVSKNTIDLQVYNSSIEPVTIYVDLLLNGEFIRQYEEEAYGDSTVLFEIDDLKSFKEYTFKVVTIAAESRESNVISRDSTTEKTFLNEVSNVFIISVNSLVSIIVFLSLAFVAVLPYIIVGAALFFPTRFLHKKLRLKFPKKIKESKKTEE